MQNSGKELTPMTLERLDAATDLLNAADNVFTPLMGCTDLSSSHVVGAGENALRRFETTVDDFLASLGCMSLSFLRSLKETIEAHIEEAERIEDDKNQPGLNDPSWPTPHFGVPALIDPLAAPCNLPAPIDPFASPTGRLTGKAPAPRGLTPFDGLLMDAIFKDLFMPRLKPAPAPTAQLGEAPKPLCLKDLFASIKAIDAFNAAERGAPQVDKQLENEKRFWETVLGVPCEVTRGPHPDMFNVVAYVGRKS
jgi:hypothetical protein